jgi:hypothetical protein
MAKFLEHVIAALAWVAVIAAGVWFGLPAIYAHSQAGEAAKATAHAQAGALDADRQAANLAQASCSTEVAHAMDAAKAIAKAAQPLPVEAGRTQPLVTAQQIKAMIQ